jgi:NADPH:quinone reductase
LEKSVLQNQIPEQMTAVVLHSYDGSEALRVEQRPVPKPGPNEVLIKVAATPINPSDLAFMEGRYGLPKATPVVPGFEGAGTVVAVGSGLMGRYLAGKRVACVSQSAGDGVWAEYVVIKTVINTAAAGALGQMIDRLGRQEGCEVIKIVRRQAQVEQLQQQGAAVVLNSTSDGFAQELHDVCQQRRARLAFDAVAGDMTIQLLEAMPNHSRVTLYGGLSLEPAQALPGHLFFEGKVVDGFWLSS